MTDATYTADPASTVSFDQVIDALGLITDTSTDATMTNRQPTTFTITTETDLGTLVATVTGAGLTYIEGEDPAVSGGTITGVSFALNGQHQGDVTTSLAVSDVLNAALAEEGGDASAIEHFFMAFNWTYYGNDFADNVPPGAVIGDDVPFNLTGNDHISLGGGNDVFFSGDGNDTIDTGTGNDQVYAGKGDDTINTGVNAYVEAGAGNDTITTAPYSTETPGPYVTVKAGGGNDTINAYTTGDYHGGAGDDRLISHETGDDDGDFMVDNYSGATTGIVANLTSTAHDGLAGGDNTNGFLVADGQGGTDRVSSFVAIKDSAFNDQFYVDSGYTSLYGNWAEIRLSGGDDNVVFDGVDVGRISYYNGAVGGPVNADMQAGTATDLNPGDTFIGHDTFSGATQFRGTAYDDVIHGSDVDGLLIRGETGNDLIIGGSGDEYLDGDDRGGNPDFSGDDTLVGGAGNDILDGNNGNDTVDYSQDGGPGGVQASLLAGGAIDTFGDTDIYYDVENLIGTSHDDTLIGDAGNNNLSGGAGADWLFGEDGNDVLDGGTNPETYDGTGALTGGVGDVMVGGNGDDTYYVDSALDYVIDGGAFGDGDNTVISTASVFFDYYGAAKTLAVSSSLDSDATATLVGNVGDNTFVGHSGSDLFYGFGGSDTYQSGDGIDYLVLDDYGLGDGNNTVIVDPRSSGATSWDVVYGFDPSKDKVDVSHYQDGSGNHQYASGADVLSLLSDDGAGNSYALLGDGADVLYFAGLTKADLHGDDFTV